MQGELLKQDCKWEINSMWSIRVLTGELAGQTFPLKDGTNVVGRTPQCDIVLPTAGVSKQHARIEVHGDKIIVADAGSRNGTFVDGVAIRSQVVREGQRIGIYDVICEIVPSRRSKGKS